MVEWLMDELGLGRVIGGWLEGGGRGGGGVV